MEKTKITPDEYFASLSDEDRDVLKGLQERILSFAPDIPQTVWKGIFWGGSEQTILGFGNYFAVGSNKKEIEWFYIGLSRQKNYYSIYVSAVKDKQYLLKSYADKLGKVKVGSSSISFTKIEKLNMDQLDILFREAVDFYKQDAKS